MLEKMDKPKPIREILDDEEQGFLIKQCTYANPETHEVGAYLYINNFAPHQRMLDGRHYICRKCATIRGKKIWEERVSNETRGARERKLLKRMEEEEKEKNLDSKKEAQVPNFKHFLLRLFLLDILSKWDHEDYDIAINTTNNKLVISVTIG